MRLVLSALFWLFLASTSVALFPVALGLWAVTRPFDPRLRVLHGFTCFWASLYTWCNPVWQVKVVGRERIRRGDPVLEGLDPARRRLLTRLWPAEKGPRRRRGADPATSA